jgi:hypothetical protein
MLPDATIFQNTVQPFRKLALQALHGIGIGPGVQTPGRLDVQRHRSDYLKLLAAGDALLAENRPGLVLLHMPIPHPWGMYDRHQNRFSDDRTSYIDNLALADVYLGHLRSVLERQGAWDRTTLVVMGDHSWRSTFVWSQSEHWTDEEEEASDDETFDKRPACLVKLAGQHAPLRLDETFEMVRTRSLIKALLDNQIRTPEALQRWVVTAN